jgi:signal transduction histidine kinase
MTGSLKILILEDNPNDAGLTLRALKMSELKYEYRLADNKTDYIKALEEFQPDVILSDHSLPSFTSEEALPIARQLCKKSVFILVTGTVSEEFAVNIIKAGADDYILKSSLMRLPSAIINAYLKKRAEIESEQNFQKLMEVNNELKTFIYRASHDLRGPLSSMKGLINIAKFDNDPLQLSKLIGLMDTSADKLDNIVVNLVETLGIREMKVDKQPIDFSELVKEILYPYESTVGKKIKFNIEDESDNKLISDRVILKMILKRIIDNAVKFNNYSVPGGYVTIRAKPVEKGIEISVIDNGYGIKEELLPKVFEMFYRANNDSAGSGLGLYLVKIGTEKIGGTITIKSIENIGTTVNLILPYNSPSA